MDKKLRTSGHLRIVPRDDGRYGLYHSLHGGLCLCDENVRRLFRSFDTPATFREALSRSGELGEGRLGEFIEIFEKKGFLVDPGVDEDALMAGEVEKKRGSLEKGSRVGVVQLVLTNLCNFKCEYCFINDIYSSKERARSMAARGNRMMTGENARAYLEQVIRIVKNNGGQSLSVQFFGGEPLLNPGVIKYVLHHFGRGEGHGVAIGYSIVTNGSLVTGEIADYFRAYDVAVIVSFDSPRGKDRKFASGKNAAGEIRQGLSLLKERGNRVILNSVLSSETFGYFDTDLVDFAFDRYIWEIGVLLDLSPGFYLAHGAGEIVDKLWKVYIRGKSRGVLLTGYWHTIFQLLTGRGAVTARGYKTCSGTGCQLSIEPSGEVFACKGSSGYFGNIGEPEKMLASENYARYAGRAFRNAPQCRGCEIENFCSGFCLGPLEKKYGDIYVVEEAACPVYRELTRRLIRDVEIGSIESYGMQ